MGLQTKGVDHLTMPGVRLKRSEGLTLGGKRRRLTSWIIP